MFRKLMLVALILTAGCQMAQAQFRWGLKAGLNLNSLQLKDWKSNFDKDNGCGFTGGVMAEVTVPVIGVCLDASLMYTHMSSRIDFEASKEGVMEYLGDADSKNFFNIPVNVKYRFGMVPVVKPFIYTGPDFAFKFGGKDDVFKTKTFQCAWNIGVGVEVFNHLQVAGSYGFGINNIADWVAPEGMQTTSDFKLKNNYWTVTLAYLF